VPVAALTFLAEAAATGTPRWSPADRSPETMQRLRHPFQTPSDRTPDDAMPDTA
jgi:hypothetical protein